MDRPVPTDQDDGSRGARLLGRAAPFFLVASLVALFLVPLAIGTRFGATGSQLSDVDDPARLSLDVVVLTVASQAAAIRAYAAVPSEMSASFADDYRNARATQARAFEELVPLLPKLDSDTRNDVIALRRSLAEWHAVHDALLAGRLSREGYVPLMGEQQARLAEVLTRSRAAFSSLNEHTGRTRERLAFLARLQTGVTAGLAALALASVFVAVWLGDRARRLEGALRERALAEQLADARADVLSWVSHDLKNPLAAIRMACTNLRRSLEKNPERAPRIVDSIDRSALRMSRLIRNLLDSARLDAGRSLVMDTQNVALEPLLERTCEEAEQSAGGEVEVRCTVAEPLPPVRGDRLRIEQALLNLIQNALQVSPANAAVNVRAEREGGFVRIAVQDEGPGVAADVVPRLFSPFRAARRGDSTGLGLFIVKGVAEAHGGTVWHESLTGGGTTFFFTVPVAFGDEGDKRAN